MIDLSVDLLAAAPASFIRSLAKQRSIDIAGLFDGDTYRSLEKDVIASVLTRPEDYLRLTQIVLADRSYTELRLTPDADLPKWRDRLEAMAEAGGEKRLIAVLPLIDPDRAKKVARAAAETAGDLLAGVTLEGAVADYAWSLDCAAEAGLATILQGRDMAELHDALDRSPRRIANGIFALDDLALVDRLAETGTVLEFSPATDIAFGRVKDWHSHPAGQLFHREVRITIGNAAPAFAPANTRDRLADAFDWDDGVFATLDRNALDAALCDDTTRTRLKEMTCLTT